MGQPKQALKPSKGITLVELLVALVIGVVLTFGAMHLLLRSKLGYLQSEELARLQENGRYALRVLSHELTMAGYLGTELPRSAIDSALVGTACFDYLLDTTRPLDHINDVTVNGLPGAGGSAPPRDCLLRGQHQVGTDVLLSRRTAGSPLFSSGVWRGAPDAQAIYLRSLIQGSVPVLQRGSGNPAQADLWEYVPLVLFLRRYSRTRGDSIPSLCRKRQGRTSNRMAPTECLVEGIENLQLEFGIDDTGDLLADRFEQEPTRMEMGAAVAARIYLLVRSVYPVVGYTDDRSYALGNTLVPAAHDGHYRRVMQATVLLRNTGVFGP